MTGQEQAMLKSAYKHYRKLKMRHEDIIAHLACFSTWTYREVETAIKDQPYATFSSNDAE